MPVSEADFRQLALEEPDAQWELHCGSLRRKPGMTAQHNRTMTRLAGFLFQQLDPNEYDVRCNSGHVRRSADRYYIPDVAVIPVALVRPQLDQRTLEVYDDPLPLVVEVWSPSTGDYDIETKLRGYQERGDLEIWRIHPYERTLTARRRSLDGSYAAAVYRGGRVPAATLPNVVVDLDELLSG
jgi:Uma2 family endonuclease